MNLTFTLILLSLIGIGITIWLLFNMKDSISTVLFGVFMFLILLIAPIFFFVIYTKDDYHEIEKHDWYIESLGNDKYLSGSFFLGSGTINEIDYYYFYVNTTNGYSRLKRPISETYIIETDNRKPELTIVYDHYDNTDKFWTVAEDTKLYYKLYVPKGTIIRDFRVR